MHKVAIQKQDKGMGMSNVMEDIGDETDHELSLSREDDSDLSVISEQPYEEKKSVPQQNIKGEQEIQCSELAESSDSESLEESFIDEESEYDEAAQQREERLKLAKIFEKRDASITRTSGQKVKLPYEMLINKLVDSLETPYLVKERELPVPTGMKKIGNSGLSLSVPEADVEKDQLKQGVFTKSYSQLVTSASISDPIEVEPIKT